MNIYDSITTIIYLIDPHVFFLNWPLFVLHLTLNRTLNSFIQLYLTYFHVQKYTKIDTMIPHKVCFIGHSICNQLNEFCFNETLILKDQKQIAILSQN